ncbi:unnamed protein product [Dovyalis caffra]|uniref:Uncharacterized protein n=1 Tax=Dovyalis caffra TaxID=77055 RepID=A0AAV1SLI5_9ROSI|nr:unnamed protein product [Dovyalis caffra]
MTTKDMIKIVDFLDESNRVREENNRDRTGSSIAATEKKHQEATHNQAEFSRKGGRSNPKQNPETSTYAIRISSIKHNLKKKLIQQYRKRQRSSIGIQK